MQEQTGGQGWAFQSLLMFNLRGRDRQISPELGVSSPTSPGKETPVGDFWRTKVFQVPKTFPLTTQTCKWGMISKWAGMDSLNMTRGSNGWPRFLLDVTSFLTSSSSSGLSLKYKSEFAQFQPRVAGCGSSLGWLPPVTRWMETLLSFKLDQT